MERRSKRKRKGKRDEVKTITKKEWKVKDEKEERRGKTRGIFNNSWNQNKSNKGSSRGGKDRNRRLTKEEVKKRKNE